MMKYIFMLNYETKSKYKITSYYTISVKFEKIFMSNNFIIQMTDHCKLCDKTKESGSKFKHFQSKTHNLFENSPIRRYVMVNSNFDEVDDIMRKYVNIH